MKIKEVCLEEVTQERKQGWEGAKVEKEDERGRSVEGKQMKKRMRRLLEAEVRMQRGSAT